MKKTNNNDKVMISFMLTIMIFVIMILLKMPRNESFLETEIPIYIISLAKKPERRQRIVSNIQQNPRYFIAKIDAVDGENWYNQYLNRNEHFIDRPGQIGCFLSHLRFWKEISSPLALILEDDADIKLPKDLEKINMALINTPKDWDIIWLGGRVINPEKNQAVNEHIIKNNSLLWHSHAYLITKTAATKLYTALEHYDKPNAGPNEFKSLLPVDDLLSTNSIIPLQQYILAHDLIEFVQMGSDTGPHTAKIVAAP